MPRVRYAYPGYSLIATCCTRMSGGFLRSQAQYLRRIRITRWQDVPPALRDELAQVACAKDQRLIDEPVFRPYGLSPNDAQSTRQMAAAAQVTAKPKNGSEGPRACFRPLSTSG
jgi:hypothetical protein